MTRLTRLAHFSAPAAVVRRWAILDRVILKRSMLATLQGGDRTFNDFVRAEADRTR